MVQLLILWPEGKIHEHEKMGLKEHIRQYPEDLLGAKRHGYYQCRTSSQKGMMKVDLSRSKCYWRR